MASEIGKTGSETGKSSWMFGAVTGFVFIIGAASSAMGVWNGISAKAATAPQVVAPIQANAQPAPPVQRIEVKVAQAEPASQPEPKPSPAPQPGAAPEPSMAPAVVQTATVQTLAPIPVSLPSYGAVRPSFDCAAAATYVESTVCATPYLASLDRRMAGLYRQARGYPSLSAEALGEQRAWQHSRDLCRDPDCLRVAYEQRVRALQEERSPAPEGAAQAASVSSAG